MSTSCASNARRSRATVPRSRPSNAAMRASPPRPVFNASSPAYRRRCFSSRTLTHSTIAALSSSGRRAGSRAAALPRRARHAGPGAPAVVDAGGLRPSRRTKPASEVFTSHPSGAHTGAQRVLGADVQEGVEFLHNRAETSGLDPGGGRRQECAGAGEPDLLVRPQTQFVELRHLVEGVVAATVGVTCPGLVRDLSGTSDPSACGTWRAWRRCPAPPSTPAT